MFQIKLLCWHWFCICICYNLLCHQSLFLQYVEYHRLAVALSSSLLIRSTITWSVFNYCVEKSSVLFFCVILSLVSNLFKRGSHHCDTLLAGLGSSVNSGLDMTSKKICLNLFSCFCFIQPSSRKCTLFCTLICTLLSCHIKLPYSQFRLITYLKVSMVVTLLVW